MARNVILKELIQEGITVGKIDSVLSAAARNINPRRIGVVELVKSTVAPFGAINVQSVRYGRDDEHVLWVVSVLPSDKLAC